MAGEAGVTFKGKKDELVVILDEHTEFDDLKELLRKKAEKSRRFFGAAVTAVTFTGKDISEPEKEELIQILIEETNISVFDKGVKPDEEIIKEIVPEAVINYGNTFFHRGSLRSGQAINYKGSVVVVGDINPGGEIIAEGNVIVIGAMKGMVHAGCGGDKGCFVFALKFSPIQLRIADSIAYIPRELTKRGKNGASYAYIEKGQIYIESK